jgi:hypothetical protein
MINIRYLVGKFLENSIPFSSKILLTYYVRTKASLPLKITNKISCSEDGCNRYLRNFSAKIYCVTSQKILILFSYVDRTVS